MWTAFSGIGNNQKNTGGGEGEGKNLNSTMQPSCLVCQKYVRKCKGAVKIRVTVLKMCINTVLVNRNETEMYANCGSVAY